MVVLKSLSIANRIFKPRVVVVDDLTADAILGMEFMEQNGCTLDIARRTLQFRYQGVSVPLTPPSQTKSQDHMCARVTLGEMRQIPAFSELEVMADVADVCGSSGTWILETATARSSAMVARPVVQPSEGKVPVRLLNPRDKATTVYQGTTLDTLERIDDPTTLNVVQESNGEHGISSDLESALWNLVCESDVPLSDMEQQQLFSLLLDYSDIFASDHNDYGHTNKVCHAIPTGESAPMRQPLRRIPPTH